MCCGNEVVVDLMVEYSDGDITRRGLLRPREARKQNDERRERRFYNFSNESKTEKGAFHRR